ncbi:Helix-turn-helix domain-containing protein [Saccharopolyspora antimicrobica]|uniref:Helix-turn-helix domain-containing protein n=1 Tax=Saccharopolyspora antimicrobica TaxID=455193 RepID=A0A1I5IW92_9PSEU|nr:helix-turn-helix transcriptional regulator [Saccharopolyspora antimicrobica]RKT83726.1 helix-turn-helix protein [Saccharopolyspora antimicrobica]SFO64600.1 Helix-turn-helix domain-containing protein [Saccharopolyspora antimicrobica]
MTTARSRGLGAELRRLRKDADLRLEELAEQCGWSRATLGRIEAGTKVPSETETALILKTLDIKGVERARVLQLAEDIHRPHWWEIGSPGLPQQLLALLEFERSAIEIIDLSIGFVPGLLQIADYTRAIMVAGGLKDSDVESRVALRLGRQRVLTGKKPVKFHALIDESVLHRPIGGYEVMAEQLSHIARMSRRPHITIQVIPYALGAHVGLNGNQLIMQFERQRTIVYLEHRRVGTFLDDPVETPPFVESVANLAKAALSPHRSAELIAEHAKSMEESHGSDHELAEVQLQR